MNTTDNRFKFIVTLFFTVLAANVFAQCTVELGNNQTICANQSVVLMPATTGTSGTVTYQWSPTTYMNTTQNGATQANPIVTPQQTTTYNITITDGTGCTATDAVTLTTSGAGPIVNATVNPTTICAGDQVNLNFTSEPANCGLNYAGCNGIDKIDSIALGFQTQTGSNVLTPTVYGNFFNGTRMQILYTAAEIAAVFGTPGSIKSVAFRIGTFNSNATLQNFSIKMGCLPASTTQLTNWETGLSTVYTAATYTPIPGWNNHNFQTFFDWDGVSSIVVEICCYTPGTSGNLVNFMVYNNRPGGVLYSRGNTDQCATAAAPTTLSERPIMRVRMCQPDYSSFTINWTPNSGPNAVSNPAIRNPAANPQTTQTYMVAVTQGAGCAGTNYVTVNVDTVTKVNAGPDQQFCVSQTLTLTATPSGSPLPPNVAFQYQWRQLPGNNAIGGNTATINVTPSTTTSYYVTMSGGPCPVYDTVTVTVGSLPVSHTITAITCNAASNGRIQITPNGVAPYTYTWSANAATGNTNQAINLGPGTYYVTVTDAQSCSGRDTIVLTQPTPVTVTNIANRAVSCNGGNDGLLAVAASGGTGAYTYNWSSGQGTNDTIYNLVASPPLYFVTATDANGCTAVNNPGYSVSQPTPVSVGSTTVKNVRCFNGSDGMITVTGAGGTSPYTYAWSHNASITTGVASNLSAGSYSVTIYDANNCSVLELVNVTQPVAGLTLPVPTFVPVTCNGGSNGTATANPQGGAGGYEYLWSNGQITQTAINLAQGTYTVTVEDDSLCTASNSVTVSQPPAIQIAGVVTNVLCNGENTGAIDVTVTNGVGTLTYAWSNGPSTQDISNVVAGAYYLTITDQTLCTQTASFTISQPVALALNGTAVTNVSCFGYNDGRIVLNPTGGAGNYTYVWSPSGSTQTISSLIAGTYDVTVTDGNNCNISASYTVTQPASGVAFAAATVTDVLCNGAATGAIATSASGGTTPYSYSWSHNAQLNNPTASNIAAGTYTITVSDNNGCTASQANTISQPTAITFTAQPAITNVSCNGNTDGSAEVFPTGGVPPYTYTWNGVAGNNPQNNLAANTYTVVVTDGNACTVSTPVVITEPGVIQISNTVTNVSCFGGTNGTVALTITGGTPAFTYVWSDNQSTATATNLSEGNYFVTVTDSRSCTATAAMYVDEPDVLTVSATSVQVSCVGAIDGSVAAQAVGGTQPWHYILVLSGTDIADNFTGAFSGLNANSYTVRVEDLNQCTATTSISVGAPVADFYTVTTDSTSCFGEDYDDGAIYVIGTTFVNQPFQYQLDGGPKQFSGDFFDVSAGEHTVIATNGFGCTTTLTAIVPQPLDATAEILPGDTIVQIGETIQLFALLSPYPSSSINGYVWGPVSGLSCTDCASPFLTPYSREVDYTVTINYNDKCSATAKVRVRVENNLEPYVPNAFTPNGDGNNDVFMIYGEGIKTLDFKIFNRWGELVFETTSQYGGWDGTYKGTMQSSGVYTYSVKVTYLDNTEVNRKGSITLIR